MSKITNIGSSLAKLAALLGRGAEKEVAPIDHSVAPMQKLTDVAPGTGRNAPRDPRMEALQSLVTNQPNDSGYYQWAVTKPNGQVHGAPFEFKGSALHVADGLNKQLPGHTVQAIPTDLAPLDRFTPRTPQQDPLKKMSPEEVDALMARTGAGTYTGMAEGGSFDPIASARERVRGQSSPGSPGVSGAIKDAVEALQSWMAGTRRDITDSRDKAIMRQAEDDGMSEGGTTGVSTEHEAGLGKRFMTRVKEQAYGLDSQGKPALGGRAWTEGQGGTPMGLLDEVTSIPHRLISLAQATRGLSDRAITKHLPGYGEAQDSMLGSIDPQWSKEASDRLDRLRQSMNREYGVGEAHSFPEHLTDAAASLVSPFPAAKAGKASGFAGRLMEMTMSLRPRTMKNFAQDSAMMGGVGKGLDSLVQHLSANEQPQGGGAPVDPENFSRDMGLDTQPIHNNHQMVPLAGADGRIMYGVDPQTFAGGGGVSRRGFLGILATAPVALSKLAGRLSPETEASVKSVDKSSLAESLRNIKSEAFGHSDEPNWGFLDHYIKTIPGHENMLEKYLNLKKAFHLELPADDPSVHGPGGFVEKVINPASDAFEDAVDQHALQNGINRLPNPNE